MNEVEPIDWYDICDEEYAESHKSCEDYNNIDI